MQFEIVLNQVLILFIILFIGFIGGKRNVLDKNATKVLSTVLLQITAPMLVLRSFFIPFSSERIVNAGIVFAGGLLIFVTSITLSKLMYARFSDEIQPVMRFTAIFSNCAYMGLPLLKAVYGDEGVFYGSFYIVLFQMFLWSYGVMMFGGTAKGAWKKVLVNPSLLAIYTGLLIFVLQIPVPSVLKTALGAVGDMTMPLSMLIVGALISSAPFRSIFSDWRVYLASFVRLLLMPLIGYGIVTFLGLPGITGAVLVTALAMPAAANTAIFTEYNNKDAVFASKCVAVSTLFAIVTVPAVISFIA